MAAAAWVTWANLRGFRVALSVEAAERMSRGALVDEKALIFPVALRYLDRHNRLNVNASYVGDTSLVESMFTLLSERKIVAELIFLPPIDTRGKSRRDLAAETHAAISVALGLPALEARGRSQDGPVT